MYELTHIVVTRGGGQQSIQGGISSEQEKLFCGNERGLSPLAPLSSTYGGRNVTHIHVRTYIQLQMLVHYISAKYKSIIRIYS